MSIVLCVLLLGVIGTTSGLAWALRERSRASTEAAAALAAQRLAEERAEIIQQISRRMLAFEEKTEEERTEMVGQVTNFARDMLAFVDHIFKLPGGVTAGRVLFDVAIANLNALAERVADDPILGLDIADAYNKIGEHLGGRRNSNLGDLDGALESFLASQRLYERHALANPRAAVGVARSLIKIGDIAELRGDSAEAMRRFADAQARAEAILRADPNNHDASRVLATSLLNRADVLWNAGRRAEAGTLYAESVAIRERLNAQRPGDAINSRDMAIALGRVGRSLADTGDTSGAYDAYMRSRAIRNDLGDRLPALDVRAARDLIVNDLAVADIYARSGLNAERLAILVEAKQGLVELTRLDPENARARLDLVAAIDGIGKSLLSMGRLAEARDAFREMRDAVRAYRHLSPRAAIGARLEIEAAASLAEVFAELGNADAADPHLSEAVRLLEQGPQPLDARRLRARASLERTRGIMLESKANARAAADAYAHGVRIYGSLPAEASVDPWTRISVGELHMRRGMALRRVEPRESRRAFESAADEFLAAGDYGIALHATARSLLIDLERDSFGTPADRAVAEISAALRDAVVETPDALRALARSQHAMRDAALARQTVQRAIDLLEESPSESWEHARSLAEVRAEADRYAAR